MLAKMTINHKYIIDNIYVNDHYVMTECYIKCPTDEDIALIAKFEDEDCDVILEEGNVKYFAGVCRFVEVEFNNKTGGVDFCLKKVPQNFDFQKWIDTDNYYGVATALLDAADPCSNCNNNPKNGGSGICHCTIPYMTTTTPKTGGPRYNGGILW